MILLNVYHCSTFSSLERVFTAAFVGGDVYSFYSLVAKLASVQFRIKNQSNRALLN